MTGLIGVKINYYKTIMGNKSIENIEVGTNVKFKFLLLLFIVIHYSSFSQSTRDLYPIEIKRGVFSTKYFYNGQSFESPYGLQIPIMQMNDSEVVRDYNKFKNSMKTAKIISIISAGISLYPLFKPDRRNSDSYWAVLGTAGLVSAFFNIRSNILLDRSLKRYNKIVSGTELGFQYNKTYYGNSIVGIGISHRF
ncbi:hypothetical protein LZF95_06060 [Algoriphagus sp. AGSA1]|uniref:hypothetical protein n=1 Tax=Algoriphagus sp. AGSA1 TaxID=2907213 RepID=UPI001F31881C|nr:hypothetical protein [Algoriphagus sp. AGSA1]MCE7054232.1 hypothetical protein [Algoriphagus sp. AGSA1]